MLFILMLSLIQVILLFAGKTALVEPILMVILGVVLLLAVQGISQWTKKKVKL